MYEIISQNAKDLGVCENFKLFGSAHKTILKQENLACSNHTE